jgi:hypothetical protein
MYSLTEQQIDFIADDIRRRGICMEDLQSNLLDHICCIIESEFDQAKDFPVFYEEVISRFFKRDLKEIEEETKLLLTFKNYYKMKKSILISGTIAAVGLIAGAIFKIMHWPGASILLLLSIASLSLIFLPLLFILKLKDSKNSREKAIVGISVLIGILLCIATLFSLMHWPAGNGAIWLGAIGISAFVLIPTYFFTGIRNPDTKLNTVVTTVILIGATCLLFAMVNLRPSQKTLEMKMFNYYQSESLLAKLERNQSADSNALKRDITNTCKQIKSLILLQRNIFIQESNLGDNFNDGHEGAKLFAQLILVLKTYNQTAKEKIPLGVLEQEDVLKSVTFFNNYNALNHLTQIQLNLILNQH